MRQRSTDLVEFPSQYHFQRVLQEPKFTLVLHTKLGEASVLANVV